MYRETMVPAIAGFQGYTRPLEGSSDAILSSARFQTAGYVWINDLKSYLKILSCYKCKPLSVNKWGQVSFGMDKEYRRVGRNSKG